MSQKNKSHDAEALQKGDVKITREGPDGNAPDANANESESAAAERAAKEGALSPSTTSLESSAALSRNDLGSAQVPPLAQGKLHVTDPVLSSGTPSAQTEAQGQTAKTAGDATAGQGPVGQAPSNAPLSDDPVHALGTNDPNHTLVFRPNADAIPGDVRAEATPTNAKAPGPSRPGHLWCVVLHGSFLQGGEMKAQGSVVEISEQEWETLKAAGSLKKLES